MYKWLVAAYKSHAIPVFFTHILHPRYEIRLGVSYDSENLTKLDMQGRGWRKSV